VAIHRRAGHQLFPAILPAQARAIIPQLARHEKKKQYNRVSEFLQRLENEIQSRRLLPREKKILVAVSSGLDSMVLLHALNSLAEKWRWKITIAHFNHQLRGRASDADEKLVCKIAAQMRLPIVAERADVKQFAQRSKLSIEMAARKLRHEFFARAARKQKIKTVALAHHADDQVELFFLRVLRGAGGAGLAGMKWRAPSSADKKITLVRPLLGLSKDELRKFARENKIQFREDASNFSSDFLRNRIRNELLPLLRKNYQPGLNKSVLRLMEIVRAESEFVGEAAAEFCGRRSNGSQIKNGNKLEMSHFFPDDFGKLPIAIQRRVLQLQFAELGVAADFDLIEQLRESAGKFVGVNPTLSVSRGADGELKLRKQFSAKFNSNQLGVKLPGKAGRVDFGGMKFSWSFKNGSRGHLPRQILREFFDADKIGNKIILRHWRAGDRFQPIGLKSPVKLQDLFTNAKIPRARRRELILATTGAGEIFWVEGLRISENFKLSPPTKRHLVWRWQRIAGVTSAS
jgi:tRNA(Ile)-lysidine synthase